jgi:hypothetical protein
MSAAVVDGFETMLMNASAPIRRAQSSASAASLSGSDRVVQVVDRNASAPSEAAGSYGGELDDEDDDDDDASGSSGSGSGSGDDDSTREASENMSVSVRRHASKPMSQQELMNRKRELLYQMSRLESKGVTLPRRFSVADSLEDIQAELDRLKLDREVDISVRFQRKMLITCVTGIELQNKTFDPLNNQLNARSDSMHDRIGDYDEVFEDLHMKYRNRGVAMAPELKLLFMLGGSGVMFHLTSTMFKQANVPGLENVMRGNPGLMRQFAQATMNTMSGQQQAPSPPPPPPPPQQQQAPGGGGFGGLGNLFGSLFGGGGGGFQQQQMPQQQQQQSFMRGPTPVADILKDMHRGAFPEQGRGGLDMDDEADEMFGELAGEPSSSSPPPPPPPPPPPAASPARGAAAAAAGGARRKRAPAASRQSASKTLDL